MNDQEQHFKTIVDDLVSGDPMRVQNGLDQSSEIIGEIDDDLSQLLKSTLLDVYGSIDDFSLKSSLVWVCGKFYDRTLIPFFVEALRVGLENHDMLLWQAIVALDNVDEEILTSNGGSSLDTAMNRIMAEKYLLDRI